jgi:hypothetical protein
MHFTKVEERLNHFCNGHVDDGGENRLCSLLSAHKNPAKNVFRIKFVWIKSALQEKIYRNTYMHIFETQSYKFLKRWLARFMFLLDFLRLGLAEKIREMWRLCGICTFHFRWWKLASLSVFPYCTYTQHIPTFQRWFCSVFINLVTFWDD